MIILGIDPGLALLGYGVIEVLPGDKQKLLTYGCISTKAGTPFPHRLRAIYQGVDQLMELYHPDDVAFEELFFTKNVSTGIQVGGARGVALVAVSRRTDNMFEYTPMQIKQAVTGWGGADKKQVQNMVRLLLKMDELPQPDDAADAIAAALTHANSLTMKQMFRIK